VLLAEKDLQATLQRIVRLAVQTIDACEYAGMSVIDDKQVTSPASSDAVLALLDRIQSETGEGPCVDAIKKLAILQTGQLSYEKRWPRFTSRAVAESAIESVLALPIFDGGTLGALNLYSTRTDAFDDHDIAVGTVFAAHASVAWSTSQEIEELEARLISRQVIGQAVGMLMARENVSEADAFRMLKNASQRLNVKLRLVADKIVHPDGHAEVNNE
jgi:transcriptional regulator with GAF, ATPase, and Fis domain